MARKQEAEKLLRNGRSPAEIAEEMGVSLATAIQYLRLQVGEGTLRFSDIYFAIPAAKRKELQLVAERKASIGYVDTRMLKEQGLSREEFELFSRLRRRHVFAGDMYEFVSETELSLHELVRSKLEEAFGTEETGWWRKGVPADIRTVCVSRREQDDEPAASPFAYTDLVHLFKIIDRNWNLFVALLPKHYASSKKTLESELARLNRIRNSVMHPVKGKKWSEADFEFVRRLRETFVNPSARG
jgi:hypothetical protein